MELVLIDSKNLCYRAPIMRGSRESFGLSAEEKSKEATLSVVNGFLVQILKLHQKFETTNFVFAWDKKPYLRNDLVASYKVGRNNSIKESVFDYIRQTILPTLGFKNNFCKVGYEADDIIASIVYSYRERFSRKDIVVVSSDKDFYQLLEHCSTYTSSKGLFTKESFESKFPFPIDLWPVYRAIAGDFSDGIPGIHRVGPVKATEFLTRTIKQKKVYELLTSPESKKTIKRNIKLINLPWPGVGVFPLQMDNLSYDNLIRVAQKLNFTQILSHQTEWRKFFGEKT